MMCSADLGLHQAASCGLDSSDQDSRAIHLKSCGMGLGWLRRLSLLVNVTVLGIGHRTVGFLARGLLCLQ